MLTFLFPEMPNNLQYILPDKVILKTHLVHPGIITRIRKGYASIYDIEMKDISKSAQHYIDKAKVDQLPVILIVANATRLLIFDKYVTH